MGKISKSVILSCLFFLLPVNLYPSSVKEDYELSEKCGKRCDDFYRKDYGNGFMSDNIGQTHVVYTNHYNKKLNKCFFLVTSTLIPKNKNMDVVKTKNLLDINENKEYGYFVQRSNKSDLKPSICNFLDKICKSEQEWDLLVKPYMEE